MPLVRVPIHPPPKHTKRIVLWHKPEVTPSKAKASTKVNPTGTLPPEDEPTVRDLQHYDKLHRVRGTVFLLVGYCPDTLPYFMGLLQEARKTFPRLDLKQVNFGKVKNSRWAKGFTLVSFPIDGPKREIPGYDECLWDTIDIGY